MFKLLIEAITVGIMTIIFGFGSYWLVTKYYTGDINTSMAIGFFLTGFLLHLTCELTGVNSYYCKNGVACANRLTLKIPNFFK